MMWNRNTDRDLEYRIQHLITWAVLLVGVSAKKAGRNLVNTIQHNI
jgi:hypothetical protein